MNKIKKIFKNIYALTLINVIIFTFLFIYVLSKRTMPVIMNYASLRAEHLGSETLKNSGISEVNKLIKDKNLFVAIKNDNGEIESINYNTVLINETLLLVSKTVRQRLAEIENGKNLPEEFLSEISKKNIKNGIVYEVPIGIATNNNLFKTVGPRIPVKIEYIGDANFDVKANIKSYGINSALVEVYIYAEVTQKIILPFQSKKITQSTKIPIIISVVKGTVSNYLSGTNSIPLN